MTKRKGDKEWTIRAGRGRGKLLRLRSLAIFGFLLLLSGGVGWFWYQGQEPSTQRKAEIVLLDLMDLLRESPHTPEELRFWLDIIADHLPVTIGQTVQVADLSGDRTFLLGGVPHRSEPLRYLRNTGYLAAYDEFRGNPAWVAYRVFHRADAVIGERPEHFAADPRTRSRVEPEAYTNSGYDRGHLAPNLAIGLLFGEEAQEETFLMSNIVPQRPNLNRRIWRDLENRIIRRYARRYEEVWVLTGPLYANGSSRLPKLDGEVAVPDAFFMILIDEHPQGLRAIAFIVPQEVSGEEDPAQFLVPIRKVEELSGLDFFRDLPPEAQQSLETWEPLRIW